MALLSYSICAAAAVGLAVAMVFQRSLYLCAICLLAVLLQASALYLLSGAPLLAFLQIMIYAGAVMVLIVVTIMAAPVSTAKRFARLSIPWPVAALGMAAPVLQASWAALNGGSSAPRQAAGLLEARIGPVLFGPYAVATEAVTLLMFLCALALVKRSRGPA